MIGIIYWVYVSSCVELIQYSSWLSAPTFLASSVLNELACDRYWHVTLIGHFYDELYASVTVQFNLYMNLFVR
jgi:hypothetical protein